MKTLSDELRAAVNQLRKTTDNNAEPTWEVAIFRDQERMLGIMSGERITEGPPDDLDMAVAQDAESRYHVVFERGGNIWYMISGTDNVPAVTWGAPSQQFSGLNPDVDFDGTFDSLGKFTPSTLMIVYEEPQGTIKFRTKSGAGWSSPVTIGAGRNPSICRGWADPPTIGTADMGYLVAYTHNGDLCYRYSEDQGSSWSAELNIDFPVGGVKTNVQIIRLADYTHGIVYDYDNGIDTEVWFLKSTRKYVHIASPDETVIARSGNYRDYFYVRLDLTVGDETVAAGAGGYRVYTFAPFSVDTVEETTEAGATGYRQVFYTGVNP